MANNELISSIVNVMTEQIHGGKSYITESDLSAVLKVSRTRLRESIQTLDAYGVIDKRQKRGITLASATPSKVEEAYAVRDMLEKYITDAVVKNVSDEDCANLEEIEERLLAAISAGDSAGVLRADLEFHHTFDNISQMEIALQIVRNLHFLSYAYLAPLATRISPAHERLIPHSEIIRALRHRDPNCYKYVRKHTDSHRKLLTKHCNKEPLIII